MLQYICFYSKAGNSVPLLGLQNAYHVFTSQSKHQLAFALIFFIHYLLSNQITLLENPMGGTQFPGLHLSSGHSDVSSSIR